MQKYHVSVCIFVLVYMLVTKETKSDTPLQFIFIFELIETNLIKKTFILQKLTVFECYSNLIDLLFYFFLT